MCPFLGDSVDATNCGLNLDYPAVLPLDTYLNRLLKQLILIVSKMCYDTHTEAVMYNKTWTVSGNPGGFQTFVSSINNLFLIN